MTGAIVVVDVVLRAAEDGKCRAGDGDIAQVPAYFGGAQGAGNGAVSCRRWRWGASGKLVRTHG